MTPPPPKTKLLATGTFDVKMNAEPAFDEHEGVSLGRATVEKQFHGVLEATSTVHMLSARTPTPSSAGYVALERIVGTLNDKKGSFVVLHMGLMHEAQQELEIKIVPGSGTGELEGITGAMAITMPEGKHHYAIEYDLE